MNYAVIAIESDRADGAVPVLDVFSSDTDAMDGALYKRAVELAGPGVTHAAFESDADYEAVRDRLADGLSISVLVSDEGVIEGVIS